MTKDTNLQNANGNVTLNGNSITRIDVRVQGTTQSIGIDSEEIRITARDHENKKILFGHTVDVEESVLTIVPHSDTYHFVINDSINIDGSNPKDNAGDETPIRKSQSMMTNMKVNGDIVIGNITQSS